MSTATIERTDTKKAPPNAADRLLHIFCSPCIKLANDEGRTPVSFCGLPIPVTPTGKGIPSDKPICVVCYELAQTTKCRSCGRKVRISNL